MFVPLRELCCKFDGYGSENPCSTRPRTFALTAAPQLPAGSLHVRSVSLAERPHPNEIIRLATTFQPDSRWAAGMRRPWQLSSELKQRILHLYKTITDPTRALRHRGAPWPCPHNRQPPLRRRCTSHRVQAAACARGLTGSARSGTQSRRHPARIASLTSAAVIWMDLPVAHLLTMTSPVPLRNTCASARGPFSLLLVSV